MSGVISRTKQFVEVTAKKLLDDAEDVGDLLDLDREKLVDRIAQMRRAVADHATARKRVELQLQGLRSQSAQLHTQARQALEQGNENLAQEALARKSDIDAQIPDLERASQKLTEDENRLVEGVNKAELAAQRMGVQKHVLQAQAAAAQARIDVAEVLSGTSSGRDPMQRLHEQVLDQQARSAAIDDLSSRGVLPGLGFGDDIDFVLQMGARPAIIDAEMAALRAELESGETDASEPALAESTD